MRWHLPRLTEPPPWAFWFADFGGSSIANLVDHPAREAAIRTFKLHGHMIMWIYLPLMAFRRGQYQSMGKLKNLIERDECSTIPAVQWVPIINCI